MRPLLLVPLLLGLSSCGLGNLVNGCRSDYSQPNFAALQRDLSAARARWQTAGIQDYRYDFTQFAAPVGFPPLRVTVMDGVVTKTENLDDPAELLPPNSGITVQGRFDSIASSITSAQSGKCQELTVTYDAADGHPLKLLGGTALRGIADGFGQWEISNFTPL